MADFATLVLGADTRQMRGAEQALGRVEDAGKRTQLATDRLRMSTEGLAGVQKKASLALTGVALAASAALGAMVGLAASIHTIAEFDSSMSKLQGVTRATADEMEKMRQIAKDLGSTTEFTSKQAADGLTFLGMAGFTAVESMEAIPAVLDLATASAMGLAGAADIASNIMSGFGIEAKNAGDVADVLAAASSRANTDVAQLGAAMSTVAPISKALGIDLADTAAAIGVMSDAGIQGERAGTALRGVLASLAGPTKQASDALADYGLTSKDINPELHSLSEIMGLLGAKGLTTADAMQVFGREAASGALVMIDGAKRLGDFGDELRNVDGAATEMAATMRDNLGGDIESLKSAVSGLILAMGDAGLTTVLRTLIQTATDLVRVVSSIANAFGGAVDFLQLFASGNMSAQIAVDNLTLAMGDEIDQANNLLTQMAPGTRMSMDLANVKLLQARAHLASADAQRQEAIEAAKSGATYQRLQRTVDETRALIVENNQAIQDNRNPAMLQLNVDRVESLNKQLRDAVEAQNAITDAVGTTSTEYVAATTEVERIQAAILRAKGGVVDFNDEVVTANGLSERLSAVIGGISFNNAISGAGFLANDLGVNIELAEQLNATLNRSAGISAAKPAAGGTRGLGFGLGNADTGALDGAALGFGNLNAQVVATNLSINRLSTQTLPPVTSKLDKLSKGAGGASKATKGLSDSQKELNKQLEAAEKLTDQYMTPLERYRDAVAELSDVQAQGHVSAETMERALADVTKAYTDTIPAVQAVEGAIDGLFDGSIRSIEDFVDYGWNLLKKFLANAVKQFATTHLVLPALGLSRGGGSIASSALGLAGGGAGGSGGLMGGLGGVLGSAGAAFGQGLMGTLSAIGSGGLAGGLGFAGSALSGATASLPAFGAALGAAVPFIGAAVVAFSLFKTKTKKLDEGLELAVKGVEVSARTFEKLQKSRLFGLIKHTSNSSETIDASPFQQMYGLIYKSVADQAKVLGVSEQAFKSYNHTIKLSTKGLSESEREAALTAEFTKVQNSLALRALNQLAGTGLSATQSIGRRVGSWFQDLGSQIFGSVDVVAKGVKSLQKEGESYSDTLARVSANLQVANSALVLLETNIDLVGLAGARTAEKFVEALGGLEAAGSAVSEYVNTFYSDSEKAALARKNLAQGFREAGLTGIPRSMEEFKDKVERALNSGNLKAAGGLISLGPAFSEWRKLQDGVVDAARAAQKAIADERMGIRRQIWELMGNEAAIRADYLASLNPESRALQELLYQRMDEKKAQEELATATETATAALKAAQDAISKDAFTNIFDYRRAFGRAGNGLTPANSSTVVAGEPQTSTQLPGAGDLLAELRKMSSRLATIESSMKLNTEHSANIDRNTGTLVSLQVSA